MTTAIRVETAVVGRRRAGVAEQPIEIELGPSPTLRELITAVVSHELAEFDRRRTERSFLSVLTEETLTESLETGAVRSGGIDSDTTADPARAAATAHLAFEDGLYQVYLDDERLETIDQRVALDDGSRLLFLRLVALAGG